MPWVDPRFGPVVAASEYEAVDGQWSVVVHRLARPTFGLRSWTELELTGSGCCVDPDLAWARAAGEAMERYAAIDHDYTDQVRWLRPDDPESTLADFPACGVQEPCPPGFARSNRPDGVVGHVRATRMDGTTVWVPAGQAHLNYRTEPGEMPVTLPISTGLAYHDDLPTAWWRGLCEVAERDALMLAWWARRPLARIDPDGDPELMQKVDWLACADVDIALFDMTTDVGIVAVLAVGRAPRYPHLVVGAGAGSDAATAAAKAVDEVVSVRWTMGRHSDPTPPPGYEFGWVRTLRDHALLYAGAPPQEATAFLLESATPGTSLAEVNDRSRWSTPQTWAEAEQVGAQLLAQGLDVYWVELDAPTDPFPGHVVKVMVPGLVPLSQTHAVRFLDTPRLQAALAGARPNPYPHPFA